MKKVCSLILVLCSLFVVAPVLAAEEESGLGFWFEGQVISNGISRTIGQYERNVVGPVGFYLLAEQDSDGYRQAYAGPTWKPFDWLELGIGIGMEHVPDAGGESNSTRTNAFFSVNWEKISLYGSFENGASSGPWRVLTAIYHISDTVGIGMMEESSLGFGPRVEYAIMKNVTIWGGILYDRNESKTNSVLAVNFSF